MKKVFGIGWAKTGTTTLGQCLKILGYKHQSRRLDLIEDLFNGKLDKINELLISNDSFEDWPWPLIYQKLDQEFPESKFILTIRQSDSWIRSYNNMINNQGRASVELTKIRELIYGFPFSGVTQQQLIARYELHNEDVINYFSNMREKLLILDWESGGGWSEICAFLNKEVPPLPLPHVNQGKYHNKYRKIINRFKKKLLGDIH